jgi:hypothetical protein
MKTTTEEEVYGAASMTADKHVELHVRLYDAETEATMWSLADSDSIGNSLEREIYGITSKEQIHFKKELSIRLIQF